MEKYDWPNWALEVNSERVHVPIDIRKMEDPAKIQPMPRISHQKKYNLKMLMNQWSVFRRFSIFIPFWISIEITVHLWKHTGQQMETAKPYHLSRDVAWVF